MHQRILYVENEADCQELLRVWFAMHSHTLTPALTAAAALQLLKTETFDIVLLDNWLPDGDGVALCRQIRALGYDLPIIFVSGAAFESDIQEAIAAGAQAYLTKPVDLSELLNTVSQLVGGQDREATASVALAKQ